MLVHDRPAMASVVTRQSPIWNWVVRGFAGARTGWRVYWKSSEPYYRGYEADSLSPYGNDHAYIEIASTVPRGSDKGGPRLGEDMWQDVVFELNNLSHSKQFDELHARALTGEISKASYIEGSTRIEYSAMKETALVYENLWRPWADQSHQVSFGYPWGEGIGTYDEWIGQYRDHSSYPWDSWGKAYDEIILPYVNRRR